MDRREQEQSRLVDASEKETPERNLEIEALVDHVLQKTVESGKVEPSITPSLRPVLTQVLTQFWFEAYSGPLPPKDYETLCPGIIDRHVTMMEEEGKTRRSCAKIEAWSGVGGLISSTIITLAVVAGAIFLICKGYPTQGFFAMLTPLGILAGVFVYGRKKDN